MKARGNILQFCEFQIGSQSRQDRRKQQLSREKGTLKLENEKLHALLKTQNNTENITKQRDQFQLPDVNVPVSNYFHPLEMEENAVVILPDLERTTQLVNLLFISDSRAGAPTQDDV